MVQNCNRKLSRNIDVRLNSQFKAIKIYTYAPATAIQPTDPPSGGSFMYRGGGVGLKSYESSSSVSSKSSRALCFFASMNFPDLGVYIGGEISRNFLKGMNWASQLFDGKRSAPWQVKWHDCYTLLWSLRPTFRTRLLYDALRNWPRRQPRKLNDRNRSLRLEPNRLRSSRWFIGFINNRWPMSLSGSA